MWSMRPRLNIMVAYSRFAPMYGKCRLQSNWQLKFEMTSLIIGSHFVPANRLPKCTDVQVPIHCHLQILTVHCFGDDISRTLEQIKSKRPYFTTLHETEGRRGEAWEFNSLLNYAGTIWELGDLYNLKFNGTH